MKIKALTRQDYIFCIGAVYRACDGVVFVFPSVRVMKLSLDATLNLFTDLFTEKKCVFNRCSKVLFNLTEESVLQSSWLLCSLPSHVAPQALVTRLVIKGKSIITVLISLEANVSRSGDVFR